MFPFALIAALAVALVFVALPVVAIFIDVSPAQLVASLDDPVTLDALLLSLETTSIAMAVILLVGTPVAWALATRRFRGRQVAVTIVELPLVLPPAVAGIGLLAALGPAGILGPTLDALGVSLVFETAGVVVVLGLLTVKTCWVAR